LIARIRVNIHRCRGHIIATLDALQTGHGFGPDNIATIHAEGYGPTNDICGRPDPRIAQKTRLSLQCRPAAEMILGQARLGALAPGAIFDLAFRAIMPRIPIRPSSPPHAAWHGCA
jgi:hypothetical protein